jgi:hypothetical protein
MAKWGWWQWLLLALMAGLGFMGLFRYWMFFREKPPPAANAVVDQPGPLQADALNGADAGRLNGVSWGDPHFVSLDGLAFDFQGVGEFVAARSDDPGFEIQVRQAPFAPSRKASVNVAVAMRVGVDRLGIYGAGGREVLRLNGQVIQPPMNRLELPGGGSIERSIEFGIGWRVTWPDSSTVSVFGPAPIDLSVAPARVHGGRLHGLLGDFDGSPADDLAVPDGQGIAPDVITFDQLYRSFADAWRVSPDRSLFDYAQGESTATFTDRSFPDEHPSLEGLSDADRATAEAACRAAGLTEAPFLDACIIDVAISGDAALAASSKRAAHLAAGPAAPAAASPAPSALAAPADTAAFPDAPTIAVDGDGVVHAAWRETTDDEVAIVHRSLADDGDWTASERLSDGFQVVGLPWLLRRPDGAVCAAWSGFPIDAGLSAHGVYLRCDSEGQWSPATQVAALYIAARFLPAFDSDGDLQVIELQAPNPVLFGSSILSPSGVNIHSAHFVVGATGVFHVVWQQLGDADGQFHRMSVDHGATWSDPIRINGEHKMGGEAALLAADGHGGVHAAWFDSSTIYYRAWSPDGGWGPIETTAASGWAKAMVLDADGRATIFLGADDGTYRTTREQDGTWSVLERIAPSDGVEQLAATSDGQGNAVLLWRTALPVPVIQVQEVDLR